MNIPRLLYEPKIIANVVRNVYSRSQCLYILDLIEREQRDLEKSYPVKSTLFSLTGSVVTGVLAVQTPGVFGMISVFMGGVVWYNLSARVGGIVQKYNHLEEVKKIVESQVY
jgi:hypothetical protein